MAKNTSEDIHTLFIKVTAPTENPKYRFISIEAFETLTEIISTNEYQRGMLDGMNQINLAMSQGLKLTT
jgi:hypothetical protein